MSHKQSSQSHVFLRRLTKFAFLVAEAAIVTAVVTVFSTANKAYASNDSVRFTPILSLQGTLQARGALGTAKDLGTVEIPTYDLRRPCYTGELAGCIYGDEVDFESLHQVSESISATRLHPFKFKSAPAQVSLFEVSF
jgi:hypothetical protein